MNADGYWISHEVAHAAKRNRTEQQVRKSLMLLHQYRQDAESTERDYFKSTASKEETFRLRQAYVSAALALRNAMAEFEINGVLT